MDLDIGTVMLALVVSSLCVFVVMLLIGPGNEE